MPTILVAGSLHYDILVEASHLPRRDETAQGARWYPKFGGKGGNQALAVARAGVACRMLGAVGRDDFGQFLLQGLQKGGVDARHVAQVDQGSGMSVAIQDPSGDYAATIVSGANLTVTLPEDPALWDDIGLLVLQNEIPAAANLALALAARKRAIPVLWNAAPARAPDTDLAPLIDILIVNAVEALQMTGQAVTDLATAAHAARALRQDFAQVIVTAGGLGLAASGPGQDFTLQAERVKVVSSHGAGDVFTGTLAAKTLRGADLHSAAMAAAQAAARHVSGADQASIG